MVDPKDAMGEGVEESSVVAHTNDCAACFCEELLEPEGGFKVEMVGRLIQQQNVGLIDEGLRKGGAAQLAAAEMPHRRFGIEAEWGDDHIGTVVEFLAALIGGQAVHDEIAHGLCGLEIDLLREVADAGARQQEAFSRIGLEFLHDEAHQRGFASAIAADEADFIAFADMQVHARKQQARTHCQVNIFHSEKYAPSHRRDVKQPPCKRNGFGYFPRSMKKPVGRSIVSR